jgi:hypothetical protein
MIAVAFLLILVGLALITPRSGGSESQRSVSIGRQWLSPRSPNRGYQGTPLRRYRLIQILGGLVLVVGGFVIIAMSSF